MDKKSLSEIRKKKALIEDNDAKEKKIHEKGIKLREELRAFENKVIMSDVEEAQVPAELMSGVIELFKEGKLVELLKRVLPTEKEVPKIPEAPDMVRQVNAAQNNNLNQ